MPIPFKKFSNALLSAKELEHKRITIFDVPALGKPLTHILKVSEKPAKRLKYNMSHVEASRQRMKDMHSDPEFARNNAARRSAMNAEPAFKEKMKIVNADPKLVAAKVKHLKALHADPEFAARRDERLKALNASPANSARRKAMNAEPAFAASSAERMRKMNSKGKFKKAHLKRLRVLNADPTFKAQNAERMRKLNSDPEFIKKNREASSIAQKKRWADFRANKK